MKPHAYLFVDGSASGSNGVGGWAAFIATASQRKLLYGVSCPTTISRCELTPIIEGLRWIKDQWAKTPGFRTVVYSDSEYTVKTLSGLYKRRKNKDLWAALDEVVDGMQVRYIWRERNSLDYMALCDAICGGLRKTVKNVIQEYFLDVLEPEKAIPVSELPEETMDIQEGDSEQ